MKQTLTALGLTTLMATAVDAETPLFHAPHIQPEISTSGLYDTTINADECLVKEVNHMRSLLDEVLDTIIESGATSAELTFSMDADQLKALKEFCEFTTQSQSEGKHPFDMGGFTEMLTLEF